MTRRLGVVLGLAALVLALGAVPAQAHKMKVFAAAEGRVISGYVYFSGGSRASGVRVDVSDRAGSLLFQGTSDAEGAFRFEANRRVDHVISVAGEDGHAAGFVVAAAELPVGLPAPDEGGPVGGAVPPPPSPPPAAAPSDPLAIEAVIEQSLARQLRPLREQIDAYQDKIWWHDVLGGIGYIVGLGGLAFGLMRRGPPGTGR